WGFCKQVRASYHVAMASPMPATRYRTGASATMRVSMTTSAGLWGKNSTPAPTPAGVYMTEAAEHGASLEATEGQMTTGTAKRAPTHSPASTHFPPPTAITQSTGGVVACRTPTTRATSSTEHSP